jgi:hypothetical protein
MLVKDGFHDVRNGQILKHAAGGTVFERGEGRFYDKFVISLKLTGGVAVRVERGGECLTSAGLHQKQIYS